MGAPPTETFGRYQLIRRLAFGGMAEIFLASLRRAEGFEKRVVLKRILPQFSADGDFVRMFVDEAVLAARLTHPNIVQIYDFGHVDGVYFIAMEFVDGIDLRRLLRQADGSRRWLLPAEAAAIGEQIARGLSYAHNLKDDSGRPVNLVHRDVSPHNIMLSRSGEAKLMDFGIAKAEARATQTATGTIKGKVAYMAPEQAAGRTVDKRSDQFALGLVLWECLSGQRMFAGDSDLEMLRRVTACEVRPLRSLRPEVPEQLESIIMRTLAQDPDERYADLSDLAGALASFRFSRGPEGAVDLSRFVDSEDLGRRTMSLPDAGGQAGSALLTSAAAQPEPATSGPEAATSASGSALLAAPASAAAATQASRAPASPPLESGGWAVPDEESVGTSMMGATAVTPPAPADASHPSMAAARPRSRPFFIVGLIGAVVAIAAVVVGVAVSHWRPSGRARVVEVPVTSESESTTLVVTSNPPGARILINGLETGLQTPASVPGQPASGDATVALVLDGFQRFEQTVRLEGGETPVSATLTAPPSHGATTAVAEPLREAALPKHKRKARLHRPAAAKRSAMPAGEGRLWLRSTGAGTGTWVDVYLGDRHLGMTPLHGVVVPAGVLHLRLFNKAKKIEQTYVIEVKSGEEVRRTVTFEPR